MKQTNNKPMLKQLLERFEPTFSEGGKLGWLHSFYEAMETFFYAPTDVTKKGAHIRDCNDMKRTIFMVIIALIPTLLFGMWNIGFQRVGGADFTIWQNFWYGFWQMLPSIIVIYVVGLAIECAFAQIRKEEVSEGFFASGILIALVLPIGTPLWMTALATAFAVVIGKEIFGGTGMNVFNPALLARLFIFFSYTPYISGESVWFTDGRTGATALSQLADTGTTTYSMWDAFIGTIPGSIGETSTLAILLGAVLLIATGAASWKIMLSTVLGALAMGGVFNLIAPEVATNATEAYMAFPAWKHLLLGGFAFGAVFMATDPVTSAQTEKGKWIYGFMIGVLAILARICNPGYPEGMMLAIILMNAFAPVIDHYVVQANIRRRNNRAKKTIKA